MDSEAYEAFILQAKTELEKDADESVVSAAVFAMQKAKLLFTGSPVGTVLRNSTEKLTASRAISPAGIPLWNVSGDDGSKYDTHEPVLQPEADWKCIFDPQAE